MTKAVGKRRSGTIVFDDLAFKLTPSERIIFGIIHRFSGYNLGECRLKPHAICDISGTSRSTFYNVIKRLVQLGMIEVISHEKSSGTKFKAYRVTKDKIDGKQITGIKVDRVERQHITPAPKQEFGNETVNDLLEYWIEHVGMPADLENAKANRRAVWNLSRKHGVENVKKAIKITAKAQSKDFAPRVSDFVSLQRKWTDLHTWAKIESEKQLMSDFKSMSIEDRVEFKQRNPALAAIIAKRRAK